MLHTFNECIEHIFPGPVDLRNYEHEVLSEHRENAEIAEKFKKPIPYLLNPFVLPNAGIYVSYLVMGIVSYILQAPLSYYLVNTLGVSTVQFSVYSTMVQLPRSLKFFYGLITDGIAVFGYRRKSWMIVGWSAYVLICFTLSTIDHPGFSVITIGIFLLSSSYMLCDVCHDVLCIERQRIESEDIKGCFKTGAFQCMAFGCVIGALVGAICFNIDNWGWGLTINQYFLLVSLIPLVFMMPNLWYMVEFKSPKDSVPHLGELLDDIFQTLQLKAIWHTMIFVYAFYVLQIPNAAWTNFLVKGLSFSDFDVGVMVIITGLLYWLGMVIYKELLFDWPWKDIFIFSVVINTIFSIMQMVLILRWNVTLGLPDMLFALGDSTVSYFVSSVTHLPMCILFMHLCPPGSEGVTFAVLSTMASIGGAVSYDLGTALATLFDVSNESLAAGDFSGMLYLTILTSLIQTSPIALLHILPKTVDEQRRLRDCGERNVAAGSVLLSVLVLSLVGTVVLNIVLIWY